MSTSMEDALTVFREFYDATVNYQRALSDNKRKVHAHTIGFRASRDPETQERNAKLKAASDATWPVLRSAEGRLAHARFWANKYA